MRGIWESFSFFLLSSEFIPDSHSHGINEPIKCGILRFSERFKWLMETIPPWRNLNKSFKWKATSLSWCEKALLCALGLHFLSVKTIEAQYSHTWDALRLNSGWRYLNICLSRSTISFRLNYANNLSSLCGGKDANAQGERQAQII